MPRVHEHLIRAGRGQPLVEHARRERRTEAQHDLGAVLGRELRRAEQRVERAHRRSGGHAASRPRVGDEWPGQRLGDAVHHGRRGRVRARHDDPLPARHPIRDVEGDRRGPRHRVPRTASGPRRWQRLGLPHQRLAEREVQVHRPRRAARALRLGHRPRRERAPGAARRIVGHTGLGEPAHRPAEQVDLVDGLRRPDVVQLRRTIGGARQQRDVRVVSLDDGRVELHGGRPAGGQHDGGVSGGETEPERVEARGALVEVHVQADVGAGMQRQRERRRPRTGREHRVGDPGAHPLVDDRRRERRLYGHGR